MQWDDNENAGFTGLEAIPWLPINNNYMEINVNREREEIGSLLMVYRELMHIRQERTALQEGILEIIEPPKIPVHLLAYKRIFRNTLIIVLINFGESEGVFNSNMERERIIFQIGKYQRSKTGNIILFPKSGLILSA